MTSPISSFSPSRGSSDPIGSPASSPAAGASSSADAAAPSSDTVTLTADAQTSTDFLEAARAASGVDEQAVQSLKADVQSGNYQVTAEKLAASIAAGAAETRS
jgi:negative regulator of flagellin synthesis FlgM